MAITEKDVIYISKLAKIKMEENEIKNFTSQLDDILKYMEKLNKLDTTNIPPTSHILDIKNVKRKDIVGKSFDTEEALENAPDKEGEFFRVPKIIES